MSFLWSYDYDHGKGDIFYIFECGKFVHVQRMDEYRVARMLLMAEVSGGRLRGRPRLGWMDGGKVALGNRGITVEAARQWKDRKEW